MTYLLVGLLMFISGFIFSILITYAVFNVGNLVVVNDGAEPYTYAEFSTTIDKIIRKNIVILDVKNINFIDDRNNTQ